MKKHLVLGALAVLALAACTKSEVVEINKSNEISLSAVSGKNLTKAADGYCNSHKPESFTVWASTTTDKKVYFTNETYTDLNYSDPITSGTYTSATSHYWPAANLDFFAAMNYNGTVEFNPSAAKPFIFKDYTVNGTVSEQKDFIYAVNIDQAKGTGKAPLNFRHALSQIEFRAKNSNKNIFVIVNGVQVVNVKNTGNFTMSEETTGNFVDHDNDVTNEDPTPTRTGRGSWTDLSGTATYSVSFTKVEVPGDGVVKPLTYTGAEYNTNSMYLLPQTLDVWKKADYAVPSTSGKAYFVVSALIYNVAVPGSFNSATDVVLWGEDLGSGNYGPKDIAVQLPDGMKWEDGFRYLYTFNFTETGMGGSDPSSGDPVLTPITLEVTVDDFVDVVPAEDIKVE